MIETDLTATLRAASLIRAFRGDQSSHLADVLAAAHDDDPTAATHTVGALIVLADRLLDFAARTTGDDYEHLLTEAQQVSSAAVIQHRPAPDNSAEHDQHHHLVKEINSMAKKKTFRPMRHDEHAPTYFASIASELTTPWRSGATAGAVGTAASAADALAAALDRSRDARNRAAEFANNRAMWPDGRSMLIKETIDTARSEVTEALARAETLAAVAKAEATQAALLKPNKDDAAIARADAMMLLDGAQGERRLQLVKQMAARQDQVGALITSGWLADYLAARGEESATTDTVTTLARREAVAAAAAQDADPARRAASQLVVDLTELDRARAATVAASRHLLDEITPDTGRPEARQAAALRTSQDVLNEVRAAEAG